MAPKKGSSASKSPVEFCADARLFIENWRIAHGTLRLQDGLGGGPFSRHRAPLDRRDARRAVDGVLRCRDWGLRSGDGRLRPGDGRLLRGRRRLLVAAVEPLRELHRGLPTARRRRRR